MKSIYWDGGGYCLMAKQLARGTFVLPTANERGVVELGASELALILEGIDLFERTTTAAMGTGRAVEHCDLIRALALRDRLWLMEGVGLRRIRRH